ncbi:hypothetical protein ACU4GG_32980 [Streptomyces nojiriensis]
MDSSGRSSASARPVSRPSCAVRTPSGCRSRTRTTASARRASARASPAPAWTTVPRAAAVSAGWRSGPTADREAAGAAAPAGGVTVTTGTGSSGRNAASTLDNPGLGSGTGPRSGSSSWSTYRRTAACAHSRTSRRSRRPPGRKPRRPSSRAQCRASWCSPRREWSRKRQ